MLLSAGPCRSSGALGKKGADRYKHFAPMELKAGCDFSVVLLDLLRQHSGVRPREAGPGSEFE